MSKSRIERVGASHRKIHTEIEIDAAPADVWAVLADTANYADWAAFLVGIKGEIIDSAKITAVFQMNPNKPATTQIEHTIQVTEGSAFYWAEKGPMGIRDNHHFRVEPIDNGRTRFVQSDELMGGMTWALGGFLTKTYVAGYEAFNEGLKAEVLRRAGKA